MTSTRKGTQAGPPPQLPQWAPGQLPSWDTLLTLLSFKGPEICLLVTSPPGDALKYPWQEAPSLIPS